MDDLCNEYGDWAQAHVVLTRWHRTHSPMMQWLNQLLSGPLAAKNFQRLSKLLLESDDISRERLTKGFLYGLPLHEEVRVGREMFANSVARLTIEVVDPNVMEIRKDVRTTFSDKLAAIGTQVLLF